MAQITRPEKPSFDARPKSIVFVINSMGGGGAERVMSELLARLSASLADYRIHLILLDNEERKNHISENVTVHQLDTMRNPIKTIIGLHKSIREISPSLVVSFLERANIANLICSVTNDYLSIISERVHTTTHLGSGSFASLKRFLVRTAYPRADAVIAVSSGIRSDLIQNYGVSAEKIVVIRNAVDREQIAELSGRQSSIELPDDYIIAVGRLEAQKNFALLVRALARVADLKLVILGEGSERKRLESLASCLNVADRLLLPGYVANPYPIIAGAQFSVSSSIAEGFPNAILEAMSLGRPMIATDCPTGPAEILCAEEGSGHKGDCMREYGILVPNDSLEHLVEALRMMSRPETREWYSRQALARSKMFDYGVAEQEYLNVIQKVIKARS